MRLKAAAVLVALVAASADAGTCREDVERRLETLAFTFDDEVKGLRIWSYSWGSIYATVALAQGLIALTVPGDSPARIDLIFGAASAAVGSASLFLLPLRFTRPLERVRAGWDDSDRCALLARAEATRERVDAEQGLGKSWVGHTGNVLFNVGLALVLGLAFNHWQAALISGVVGITVGEVNLLTQPTHLDRAGPGRMRLVPIVSRDFNGAGLVVGF